MPTRLFQILSLLFCTLLPIPFVLDANVSQQLSDYIPPQTLEKTQDVGYITIDDKQFGIGQHTWYYVHQALAYYAHTRPCCIILELNTPGGEVFASQKISDALKQFDIQYNIPVICYINNWAISAGAMLAYSCRFITTAKDGAMGAATPVISNGGNMEAASEKIQSALRTDFANRAQFFDRDPHIAEAMVDKDLLLVQRQGRVVELYSEDEIRQEEPDPDQIISQKGKLLTLSAQQLAQLGIADFVFSPQATTPVTPEEKRQGRFGIEKTVFTQIPFFAKHVELQIDTYQMDLKTQFFAWIMSPLVSSILFLGVLVGGYLEFSTPGLGFPGSIALICGFLLLLSSFALDIGGALELVLLLGGLALVLTDLFLIPTFGILGFAGIVFFLAGFLGLVIPGLLSLEELLNPTDSFALMEVAVERLAYLGLAFLAGCVLLFVFMNRTHVASKSFGGIISSDDQEGSQAFATQILPSLVGTHGTAVTSMHNAGKIVTDSGQRLEALSQAGFLPRGQRVHITSVEGNVVVVEPCE